MPQDINDQLERLRANDEHLYRVVLGDAAARQPGMLQNLEEIKANTEQIQVALQRLWVAYGMLVGVLVMVVLQTIWENLR